MGNGMKVLFVANVVKTHIMEFHIPYIKWFKEQGYETYVCAKNDYKNKADCVIPYCDHFYDIPFHRSPLHRDNVDSYKQLKKIVGINDFKIIHCHTPIGGVLARLAARNARKKGTKVIYTAHGFHFYKGGPKKNWLMYYPVERLLAHYTDMLVTINKEDYKTAENFKAEKVVYVPGVGIDVSRFNSISVDVQAKRAEIGVKEGQIALLSVGELIKRKNHEAVIRSLAKHKASNVVYLICGQGILDSYLKDLAISLCVNVRFLGYRSDIPQICRACDVFVFPSFQEGLPVALMEAMAAGLPIVCSNIRGNTDLIEEGIGGYFLDPKSVEDIEKVIKRIIEDRNKLKAMRQYNLEEIKKYDRQVIMSKMVDLYQHV